MLKTDLVPATGYSSYSFCCIFYNDKTPVIILIIDGFPAVNVQMLHVYSMDNTKS